jgi:hypothetical protein
MTNEQRDTLRHMLGWGNGHKKSYRNYFACGDGQLTHLRKMEENGLVRQYREPTKYLPYHMFTVTEKGISLVKEPGETI